MSHRVNKEAEFAYGAGQVNLTRTVNPGLVYDMDDFAYIQFICHEGYDVDPLYQCTDPNGNPVFEPLQLPSVYPQ
ncbi:hypothetical protein JHK87_016531 [Glycine soja]|nr:hypothetical protein JHK87_016531 [Glycine soja]